MNGTFLRLIQSGSTAEVADAVQADPGLLLSRDPQGVSPLLWAIYFGQAMVRDFFLARLAADRIALDIFEAAATGNVPALHSLLEADPNLVHAFSGDGWTPLHLAAAFGNAASVSSLITAGAALDAVSRNPQQNQPLHAALALGRNPETIRVLLENGASANAVQAGGFTPLFSAATANRKDLAELLLARGADPSHSSDQGKTAADFARERGHTELADWLDSPQIR
jgi:ankyrin repeat protein